MTTAIEDRFQEYFSALDRAGHEDRCFICRRSPGDVKQFFGFREDGQPIEPERYGLEDVVMEELDVMSYRGLRPVCAVCQLNYDSLHLSGNENVLRDLLDQMREDREQLWPERRGSAE